LKSQPEYRIRRVAVFTGYGHPEPAPAWPRVAKSPAVTELAQRSTELAQRSTVIQLEPVARRAQLQHAA
jgi:hypothetical protein